MQKIPFVDLFCGAGGLSVGFELAGFEPLFANDNDPFACETYAFNHPGVMVDPRNIEEITASEIIEASGERELPLVIGGPNCQGVSLRGKRDPDDPKNEMFFHFKRLIEGLKPDWFVMENVPGLLHKHNQGLATAIFEAFHSIGYRCGGEVLLAADYGVPQLRYRLFIVGNRHGLPIMFPDPTHKCPIEFDNGLFPNVHDSRPPWLTSQDAISDLPELANGGGDFEVCYNSPALTEYQQWSRNGGTRLYNHVCHRSSDSNIRLIKYIPQGKNWKSIPERYRPERFKHVALKDHTTTYGRLSTDSPSRTITTYFNNISSGAFTHPEQHRGISVREGARFQGFPDAYVFKGSLARQYRQVGNAVPPILARSVAGVVYGQISGESRMRPAAHAAAIEYSPKLGAIRIQRPVQGMRFNLDRYLVRS
jgi:DNA (cytosine-5)-methyltransferase 1